MVMNPKVQNKKSRKSKLFSMDPKHNIHLPQKLANIQDHNGP